MKRALLLAVLLTFSWLQGYQLCDASEDTTETLQNVIAPAHNLRHAAMTAPDNEYDTAIPLVVDQTLQPGTIPNASQPLTSLALDRTPSRTLAPPLA